MLVLTYVARVHVLPFYTLNLRAETMRLLLARAATAARAGGSGDSGQRVGETDGAPLTYGALRERFRAVAACWARGGLLSRLHQTIQRLSDISLFPPQGGSAQVLTVNAREITAKRFRRDLLY